MTSDGPAPTRCSSGSRPRPRAAAGKTEEETVVLDVGDVLAITSYFVITGGRNARQVKAVAEEVEEQVAAAGGPRPLRVEGLDTMRWVLLDYGDFVVHVLRRRGARLLRARAPVDRRAAGGLDPR